MTAQISDRFSFRGENYQLIGMTDGELIKLDRYGMEPEMIHTACWRGFHAAYELTEDGLYLRELTVKDKNNKYPSIGGVQAEGEVGSGLTYRGLAEIVPFTGKIRLAKDFVDGLYVHMGYQKPSSFEMVLDITLEEGRVVSINDRSEEMREKRGDFKKRYELGKIVERIEDAFSLDMDLE